MTDRQYDMTAVFEAVVNAVAHRDYSIRESKIRLRLFANRLRDLFPWRYREFVESGQPPLPSGDEKRRDHQSLAEVSGTGRDMAEG